MYSSGPLQLKIEGDLAKTLCTLTFDNTFSNYFITFVMLMARQLEESHSEGLISDDHKAVLCMHKT